MTPFLDATTCFWLNGLTCFSVEKASSHHEAWYLDFDGKTVGFLTDLPKQGPKARIIRTVNGITHDTTVSGLNIKECLLIAKDTFFDMADWDRDADPVDEEAEIDRERHAD